MELQMGQVVQRRHAGCWDYVRWDNLGCGQQQNTAVSRTGIFLTLPPGPWTSVNTGPIVCHFSIPPKASAGHHLSLTMIINIQELTLSLLPTPLSSPLFWTTALLFPGLSISPTTVLQKNFKFYILNEIFFSKQSNPTDISPFLDTIQSKLYYSWTNLAPPHAPYLKNPPHCLIQSLNHLPNASIIGSNVPNPEPS